MAGKRYYASGGIRDRDQGEGWPFAVIFGPSGQAVQLPYPKGYDDDTQFASAQNVRIPTSPANDGSNIYNAGFPTKLAAYEMTFSHVQVEWFRNHLTNCFIDGATNNRNIGYAFQPYGQPASGFFQYHPNVPLLSTAGRGQPRINSFEDENGASNFDSTQRVDLLQFVMQDGFNWMQPFYYNPAGFQEMFGFKKIAGGGLFWAFKTKDAEAYSYGLWNARFPHHKFVSSVSSVSQYGAELGSGWKGEGGNLDSPDILLDSRFQAGFGGAPGNVDQYCGIKNGGKENMPDLSTNIHDILYHKGHVWAATQYNLMCVSPGGKMQIINDERASDVHSNGIATRTTPTQMSNYATRREVDSFGGPASRSLASHDGDIFMLNNLGNIFLVRPGGIREVADLTSIETLSSSGIFGGSLSENPILGSPWGGSSAYRCKLISFNGELHAFLNFKSNFNVAKDDNAGNPGFGRGVFWATSTDGVTWADQSSSLPASGIIKPSGLLVDWTSQIAPYRFSATPELSFPSGILPDGNNTLDYPSTSGMAGPSGFSQEGVLDTWASGVNAINSFDQNVGTSGVILDDEGTAFDQLRVPLSYTRRVRSLYPTTVVNPGGYGFINAASGREAGIPLASGSGGVYSPSGVGSSGLDYTGCRNYHISAFVDEVDNTMKVMFSEDYSDGGTMVFELNTASNWRLINHVRDSKQLNGLVPIDLYDPEVIICSGTQARPNPSHDPVNKTVTIDYETFDWPFWRNINVEVQYSIDDGTEWKSVGTINNIDTSNKSADPSGIVGAQHSFVWNYADQTSDNPLSPNVFYAGVQIRMRGVDPTFTNPI